MLPIHNTTYRKESKKGAVVGEGMRINRYLAMCGVCSRREADRAVESGRVYIDGVCAVIGQTAGPGSVVEMDGQRVTPPGARSCYLYNKPAGVTCTMRDAHADRTISRELERLGLPRGLKYAGRLDRDSEGLMILTDDGEYAQELTRGGGTHEKEYRVTLTSPYPEGFLRDMSGGVYLRELNRRTLPCETRAVKGKPDTFDIVLRQGLNRQIRRMCAECGMRVRRLVRTRIDDYRLEGIPVGGVVRIY